jgi:hypothetical protein
MLPWMGPELVRIQGFLGKETFVANSPAGDQAPKLSRTSAQISQVFLKSFSRRKSVKASRALHMTERLMSVSFEFVC